MAVYGTPFVAGLTLMSVLARLQHEDETHSPPKPTYGVRAAMPAVAALVEDGRRRSSTFRALLRDLDGSDWIVFVQPGSCQLPGVSACMLHSVGTFHGVRYLRVVLSETPKTRFNDDAIATIGHELRHAVEVVKTPGISAGRDILELYRRIGYIAKRTPIGNLYETSSAQETGAAVLRDLEADGRVARNSRRAAR